MGAANKYVMAIYNIAPIHGRGSLVSILKVVVNNAELDIGDGAIFFEVPQANIRKALPADTADPEAKRLLLTNTEVGLLPTTPTAYAIIDESIPDYPQVILEGTISRSGYTVQPNG